MKALLKFFKKFFKKETPVAETVKVPAKGVVLTASKGMFKHTIKHLGGDAYLISTTGILSKSGTGVIRYGEAKALRYFEDMLRIYG